MPPVVAVMNVAPCSGGLFRVRGRSNRVVERFGQGSYFQGIRGHRWRSDRFGLPGKNLPKIGGQIDEIADGNLFIVI